VADSVVSQPEIRKLHGEDYSATWIARNARNVPPSIDPSPWSVYADCF